MMKKGQYGIREAFCGEGTIAALADCRAQAKDALLKRPQWLLKDQGQHFKAALTVAVAHAFCYLWEAQPIKLSDGKEECKLIF